MDSEDDDGCKPMVRKPRPPPPPKCPPSTKPRFPQSEDNIGDDPYGETPNAKPSSGKKGKSREDNVVKALSVEVKKKPSGKKSRPASVASTDNSSEDLEVRSSKKSSGTKTKGKKKKRDDDDSNESDMMASRPASKSKLKLDSKGSSKKRGKGNDSDEEDEEMSKKDPKPSKKKSSKKLVQSSDNSDDEDPKGRSKEKSDKKAGSKTSSAKSSKKKYSSSDDSEEQKSSKKSSKKSKKKGRGEDSYDDITNDVRGSSDEDSIPEKPQDKELTKNLLYAKRKLFNCEAGSLPIDSKYRSSTTDIKESSRKGKKKPEHSETSPDDSDSAPEPKSKKKKKGGSSKEYEGDKKKKTPKSKSKSRPVSEDSQSEDDEMEKSRKPNKAPSRSSSIYKLPGEKSKSSTCGLAKKGGTCGQPPDKGNKKEKKAKKVEVEKEKKVCDPKCEEICDGPCDPYKPSYYKKAKGCSQCSGGKTCHKCARPKEICATESKSKDILPKAFMKGLSKGPMPGGMSFTDSQPKVCSKSWCTRSSSGDTSPSIQSEPYTDMGFMPKQPRPRKCKESSDSDCDFWALPCNTESCPLKYPPNAPCVAAFPTPHPQLKPDPPFEPKKPPLPKRQPRPTCPTKAPLKKVGEDQGEGAEEVEAAATKADPCGKKKSMDSCCPKPKPNPCGKGGKEDKCADTGVNPEPCGKNRPPAKPDNKWCRQKEWDEKNPKGMRPPRKEDVCSKGGRGGKGGGGKSGGGGGGGGGQDMSSQGGDSQGGSAREACAKACQIKSARFKAKAGPEKYKPDSMGKIPKAPGPCEVLPVETPANCNFPKSGDDSLTRNMPSRSATRMASATGMGSGSCQKLGGAKMGGGGGKMEGAKMGGGKMGGGKMGGAKGAKGGSCKLTAKGASTQKVCGEGGGGGGGVRAGGCGRNDGPGKKDGNKDGDDDDAVPGACRPDPVDDD